MNDTIIIIGAGAAGLMAAKELSAQQKNVIVLEANKRLGGRIYTMYDVFEKPVEAGAEFIHGKLTITHELMKEANISFHATKGKMLNVEQGEWKKQNDFTIGWDELMQKMEQLKEDMTVATFLKENFSDKKYDALRDSVTKFAEGFDLADIEKASVFALRDEWSHEEGKQYRVDGGYQKIIDYLADECTKNGATIHTSCIVKEVHWKKGEVKIICADNEIFYGSKVIVTVPLGVLQAELNAEAAIAFTPSLYDYFRAAKNIGYGTVTKILFQFNEPFWKDNIGFILSDENIPVWWTQSPDDYPLLTGWLNGAQAKKLPNTDAASLLQESLQTLSNIFKIKVSSLKQKLTAWHIEDWSKDRFALGGYSYDTLQTANAKKILNAPIEQTIFFAGEGLYEGEAFGTVEAAFVSGREAAQKVMAE
jgi:monoamine oxidase